MNSRWQYGHVLHYTKKSLQIRPSMCNKDGNHFPFNRILGWLLLPLFQRKKLSVLITTCIDRHCWYASRFTVIVLSTESFQLLVQQRLVGRIRSVNVCNESVSEQVHTLVMLPVLLTLSSLRKQSISPLSDERSSCSAIVK